MKTKKTKPRTEATPSEALSLEELALFRAGIEQSGEDRSQLPPHDTSDRAHLVRLMKKNKGLTVTALFLAVALVVGLVFGILGLVHLLNSRPNRSDFTVMYGTDDKNPVTVQYKHAVRDGVFYVDMKQIAAYAGITVSGDHQRLQFTAADNCYLRVEHGSELAVINGDTVEMKVTPLEGGKAVIAKAIITDTECLIPYELLLEAVSDGLLFRLDRETNTLTVQRTYYNEDDPDEREPVAILFRSDRFAIIPPVTEPPKYTYSYRIDMTPYFESITTEYLLLANKTSPLSETYAPDDLTELTCKTANNRIFYLRKDATIALQAMLEEMAADGVEDIYVTSAYRNYQRQYDLFWGYVQTERNKGMSEEAAIAEVLTYSAYPGTSEHQTGLCVDFMTSTMLDLDNSFAETDAAAWLRENAYKFGFILRYPEDKVAITQYSHESWHYRFVGRNAASDIHFQGICLEEYLGVAKAES